MYKTEIRSIIRSESSNSWSHREKSDEKILKMLRSGG